MRKLAKRKRKIFFRFFRKYTPNTFIINSKIFFHRRIQNSCRKGLKQERRFAIYLQDREAILPSFQGNMLYCLSVVVKECLHLCYKRVLQAIRLNLAKYLNI